MRRLRPLGQIEADDAPPTRISVQPRGALSAGDYTVVWAAQPADGGEILAGAYPLRTGVVANPGAARLDGESPAPWAVLPALSRSSSAPPSPPAGSSGPACSRPAPAAALQEVPVRIGTMALGALAALLATALLPVPQTACLPRANGPLPPLATSLWAMPLGWWIPARRALCPGAALSRGAGERTDHHPVVGPPSPGWDWAPVWRLWPGSVSPTDASSLSLVPGSCPRDRARSTPARSPSRSPINGRPPSGSQGCCISRLAGVGSDSDVARFRSVRWIGGVLLAVSIATGVVGASLRFSSASALLIERYGQVLVAKGILILVILASSVMVMVAPRRLDRRQGQWFT